MTWTPDDDAVERALEEWWGGRGRSNSANMRAAIVAAVGALVDSYRTEVLEMTAWLERTKREREELRAELERTRETIKALNRRAKGAAR